MDEIFNMTELLTTRERDFLLRSNGDKVKVESLKGKVIGIHCVQVRRALSYQQTFFCNVGEVTFLPPIKLAADLLDAYEEHYSKGDFEVVSVAVMDETANYILNVEEETFFNHKVSNIPWLLVPFSDIEARRKLTKAFASRMYDDCQLCSFVDSNGKVLVAGADGLLHSYGADFYPFTYQREKELISERLSLPKMSLHSLLSAPNRDFVISNRGEKVPISMLEGKVVGLYLYGSDRSLPLLPKLHSIYNDLKVNRNVNFEIVFVNLHFTVYGCGDEDSFIKAFRNMPWLALPFRDSMCRKLWWKYNQWCEIGDSPGEDGVFVVISSDGKSIDPYGAKVIIEYGVEAYPFTREKAAEVKKEIIKQQRILPMMMASAQYLIQNDEVEVIKMVDMTQMLGKSIILFVGSVNLSGTLSFLPELVRWYKEIRSKDDKFEIIYISRDRGIDVFEHVFYQMPWPVFPDRWWWHNSRYSLNTVVDRCPSNCHLIALGQDGVIRTIDAARHLRCRGVDAYPFTDADLLEDVSLEHAQRLVWTHKDKEGNEYIPNYRSGMQPRYVRGCRH